MRLYVFIVFTFKVKKGQDRPVLPLTNTILKREPLPPPLLRSDVSLSTSHDVKHYDMAIGSRGGGNRTRLLKASRANTPVSVCQ